METASSVSLLVPPYISLSIAADTDVRIEGRGILHTTNSENLEFID